jgi:tripartite-type tricarboxylate transporter receptor subunit TctC
MQRNHFIATASLAVLAALPGLAVAQNAAAWPSHPIHLVVPFTPGGSTDILARAIGQKLSEAWGQPVVIDNMPGAGGSIGADRVAKAAPDGYTLLMGHIGTLAVTPSIYPNLPYDPIKSFAPVAWIARVPNVLVVHPSVPAKNVRELIALAKSQPGKLNYGSGGNGSAAHIATEYLKLQSQIFMVHVPYRGTAPAVTDLVGGQIQLMFTGAPAVMPFVKGGQLRALAVSSPKRLAAFPDLPTVAESGMKELAGFEADQWYGIVAPAATPRDIITKLNTQINASLNAPELKARLQAEGAEATPNTPEVFGKLIATEIERWRPVVKAGKVRSE